MAAVVSIIGIDEAIKNLDYKAKDSPKLRLIQAIRAHYPDERAVAAIRAIDPDTLASAVWDAASDSNRLRSRRKNLASLRSSVNLDLKNLFENGRNPDGIIIGSSNTFVMSDEAKDQMLTSLAAAVRKEGVVTLGQIMQVLSEIEDLLAHTERLPSEGEDSGGSGIRKLKQIVEQISRRVDLHSDDGPTLRETPDGSGTGPNPRGILGSAPLHGGRGDGETERASPDDGAEAERTRIEVEEPGAVGSGLVADGVGVGEKGSGFGNAEEDDHLTEGAAAEELELDELEVIEEPEDLEMVDETDDPGLSDHATAEGLDGKDGPDLGGTGDRDGGHGGLDTGAEIEGPDLDEIVEEDNLDVEVFQEAGPENGDGRGPGTDPVTTAGPSGEGRGMDPAEAPQMGLPMGSIGLDPFEETDQTPGASEKRDHKLLAEAFDGYLGAMERFYNQYILIPKGTYTVGGGPTALGLTERRVPLPDFYMGKFPVTNALFEVFVEKTGYRTTAETEGYGLVYYPRRKKEVDATTGKERVIWNAALVSRQVEGACWYQPLGPGSTLHRKRSHPVVQVSLEDASAFAAWTGKRLPSEAEWEAASRASVGHPYPWGDQWMDECCNVEETQVGDTTPVDAYLEAAGPFGIADTLGNVVEWTLDRDQTGENQGGACYIVKGGNWASTSDICLCSRLKVEPDARSNILGFRCVAV